MSSIIHTTALILCFVAGKSGGHLLPCITQAEKVAQSDQHAEIYLFSSGNTMDYTVMEKHPTVHHYVPCTLESIPYQKPWRFPVFIYEFISYLFHAFYKLAQIKPCKIISFGGLNSIPTCLAGICLGIPFELYELNVQPGLTTKFLSYFTSTIYICFEQTAQYFAHKNCILTNYPIRFTEQDRIYDYNNLLTNYNFSPERKTILILGGSQGSVFINQLLIQTLEDHKELSEQIQIVHQVGIYDSYNYQDFYQKYDIPAVVFSYHEQLQNFYNLADLIISRAGAGTLFEIEFFKKPCIIIPLETAYNNHQVDNAYAITSMYPDRFTTILQKECKADFAHNMMQYLLR